MNSLITLWLILASFTSKNDCVAFTAVLQRRASISRPNVINKNALTVRSGRSATTVVKSSNDDEIAKLEEQLKRLKEAREAENKQQEQGGAGSVQVVAEDEEEVPIEMFLSEGWKEKEVASAADSESESRGGLLTGIAAVAALIVGIGLFSQVPIGQEDLSRYSAIKAPTQQIDLGDLNKEARTRSAMGDL
jgi:uncharacterized protein HemX